jgi:3' terminal RNA ribose 2'-O-methyltransferase Hen1
MLLTLATTHRPATDLGFLLFKHPGRVRTVELSFGRAHVVFPEAGAARCTAALLLDIDPVALVRDRAGPTGGLLGQYVSDRPYVASSFLSVAIARVLGTAMAGRSADRPELAAAPIPMEARLPVLPCRGGEPLLRRLLEPLGYTVTARPIPLDSQVPEWGDSRYLDATLTAHVRLADLLTHLYVLLPVLDDEKHYWITEAETDKLLAHGGEWLAAHPERDLIARRYLRRGRLTRDALARLAADTPEQVVAGGADPDAAAVQRDREEAQVEERLSLNQARIGAVTAALRATGARRVIDLGCGEGRLLKALLPDRQFTELVGADISHAALEAAARTLHLDRATERTQERVKLLTTALTYRDRRLAGFDAATLVEVVEHLDPGRLAALEQTVFAEARPATVIITTPNVEYNVRFEWLPAGSLRHRDHRFEWTREQFRAWATGVADRHGYHARFVPVGPEDPEVGPPTQMAVLQR